MEVCLPNWLLVLLTVGAIGTGVYRQVVQIRRDAGSEDDE